MRTRVLAAAEIDRVGDDPRFVQVCLCHNGVAFGKRQLHPIYEAATRHGLPIASHPGPEGGGGTTGHCSALDPQTYYIQTHCLIDQPAQVNVLSLATEGTFKRFPTLKFSFIEYGYAWLPNTMWKLDKDWKGLRREVPWVDRPPSEYIRQHIRFTTQPMVETEQRHLDAILEMMYAEDVLMFSSDYPHWDNADPNVVMQTIPKEFRSRVLFQNARELLRIPPSFTHPAWEEFDAAHA